MPAEIPLPGGLGSGGAVVRVGDTVRRPRRPYSDSVNHFLCHLADVGFDAAPVPLGVDDSGRDILSWVEGDVAIPPFPAWAADDRLLLSVAGLQRRLHDAARSYRPLEGAMWQSANLPPPAAGDIVCHNDLCIENLVVRDGVAVGVIDFDFAAPTDPRRDIAIATRHWVPVREDLDLDPAWRGIDRIGRMQMFLDAHELTQADRRFVVRALGEFLDQAMATMRVRAETEPAYRAIWDAGYPDQNRRSRAWLDRHTERIAA